MKKLNLRLTVYLLLAFFGCFAIACNDKYDDDEIQQDVNKQLQASAGYEGVNATVKDGVVILNGECAGDTCAQNIAERVKKVEGVERVENNIKQTQEGTDFTLRTSVQNVISKYQGVQADVAGGVVVLRGSINRDQLQPLMNELQSLQPKKVDNQLAVK